MNDKTWKTALWDTSWEELYEGKFSEEGICRFSKTNGATLEMPFGDISKTRVLQTTGMYVESIIPKRYQYLFGITQDGTRLALCNALSNGVGESIPGSTHETLGAPTVLESRSEFDPAVPMLSAQFDIELLRDWLGVTYSPIRKDDTYTFDYDKGRLSLPLLISSKACIEIRAGIDRPRMNSSGTSISYYCHVCIEYPYGKTLDEIWHTDLWKLQSLFAFCFGTYPEVTSAKVRHKREDRWIHVYRSSANTSQAAKLSPQPPIQLHQLGGDGLLRLAQSWFALRGDEQHAAEMLTSLLGSWNMPLDLKLLAATTMFESLIRANRSAIYDKEELMELIEPVIASANEEIRERVKGLLGQLAKPSYNQMLKEAYEEAQPWSQRLLPRWSKFRDEQYVLRISGAHGIESDENPRLRIDHYYAQITLAYFILMKRLGLSTETIDGFEQSNFLNVARWEITKHYANSSDSEIDKEHRITCNASNR